MNEPTGLADLLAAAERTIERLEPAHALARVEAGAALVDVRSTEARRRDGSVPGALHIPRTVLEWRLEPGGSSRSPYVAEGTPVILLCEQGYSSVFAAAVLLAMGVDAADVIGGFAAWRDAGLPVVAVDDPPLGPDELAGWRPS